MRQEQLLAEKQRQEQELLEKEQQYGNLQEEVQAQRKIIKTLRQKYKQAQNELKDIEKDQGDKSEEYLETIREQEKDLDFLNAIVGMMLKEGEMYRLKERVEYDFETGKWKVPPFYLKNKEVAFPKIKNAMNLVRENLDQREIIINDTGDVLSDTEYNPATRNMQASSRRGDSKRGASKQLGRNEAYDGFKRNGKQSRQGSMGPDGSQQDSPSGIGNFDSRFGEPMPLSNKAGRNKYTNSQNSAAALEYYASNAKNNRDADLSDTSSQQ